MSMTRFEAELQAKAKLVNERLQSLITSSYIDDRLRDAVAYILGSPGKRIRSVLLLWCCELVSGQVNRNAEFAAAAIELVHTYSLVHDDLPAMDDDDFRRGRPTCHKVFDEATAILAGDALLTLAFEILAKAIDKPATAVKLVGQLAQDAGPSGMVAGQIADLEAEKVKGSKELLEYIHINKTAKMFRCAAVMGAICGGAKKSQIQCLLEYGMKIGLGFQIADDILDVCSTSEQLGKTAGKDKKALKCTYPAVFGMEKSRMLARKLADEAIATVKSFGEKADILRELAVALLNRTK